MSPAPSTRDAAPDARYRRYLRRETHRSRSAAQIVVLVLIALIAAYVGTEAVLAVFGAAPLLLAPSALLGAIVGVTDLASGAIIGIAVGTAILALIVLILALAPGARARHTVDDDRLAVVIDDGVIASSLARSARTAARSRREDTSTSIGRRTAVVEVTPSSGITVDRDAVQSAVDEELGRIAARPATRATVRVSDSGRI
ncbi:DNA/RNA endonuclease G [Rathayibacter sp. VKM Ac-2760]|uniref:DNA/RNA endonuclease G n=1 Tax=Rathayibacter sp. VKM Ac-2760 TaxID=2609253 RepID=UPI0013186E3C|nr:DNA/RNA endonuclease G [Rathayibacter sp. VKM Ac-2760]QHC59821.1 DNA/RNA endonuclease G [Rathayibacter sp. VKM Ac-2760]